MGSPTEGQPGTAIALGNLVHDALAAFYDPERKADPVAFVIAAGERMVQESPIDVESIEADVEMARIMLTGYLEWREAEGIDQGLTILGTERFAEAQLVEGVTLLSKLDAPVLDENGAMLAFEHKTTGSLAARMDTAKLDTQFLTEHLVRYLEAIEAGMPREEAEHLCQGVLVNMLRKVKRTARANPPFYGRELVTHNIKELSNHWRHVVAVAREIQETRAKLDAGEDHHTVCYPNPTMDCSWDCPFYAICVMADDGSDFEGALAANYEERDPLARYTDALPTGGTA
jgi:hypothetical protein